MLVGRLREAIWRLNSGIPEGAREEALRKVLRVATTSLVQTNRAFPHFIVFQEDADTGALHKIIAGYHKVHAVNAAVEETVRASDVLEVSDDGNRLLDLRRIDEVEQVSSRAA